MRLMHRIYAQSYIDEVMDTVYYSFNTLVR